MPRGTVAHRNSGRCPIGDTGAPNFGTTLHYSITPWSGIDRAVVPVAQQNTVINCRRAVVTVGNDVMRLERKVRTRASGRRTPVAVSSCDAYALDAREASLERTDAHRGAMLIQLDHPISARVDEPFY